MTNRAVTTATLTLTALLALAGCAGTTGSGTDMSGMDHGSASPSATADAAVNNADIMFATMMIEHHTQAIEMSNTILTKEGIDPDVTALAGRIKAAQGPEISQLQTWLDAWGADPSEMGSMDHGSGMMTKDDMQALDAATGVEASRLFLEQMIQHHQGAIGMAEDQVNNGQDPDAVAMAEKIINDQTAEISEMQQLLTQL